MEERRIGKEQSRKKERDTTTVGKIGVRKCGCDCGRERGVLSTSPFRGKGLATRDPGVGGGKKGVWERASE